MSQRLSDVERRLREKWLVQSNRPALKSVYVNNLRGMNDVKIEFKYPVVALIGGNGTGKSTLLAVAACAYHSDVKSGYVPRHCKVDKPYYTFNSFFVGSQVDGHFEGAEVKWEYFENGADKSLSISKKGAGKWMHYERRPKRPVVYIGIDRVLPAMEKAILKKHFAGTKKFSIESVSGNTMATINRVTGLNYSDIGYASNRESELYKMKRNGQEYTSFHSGAGEEVICEVASYITSVPRGSLVLIEELEVGLHPALQCKLVEELKAAALDKELQILITTHSHHVVESIPEFGRVLLKRNPKTLVVDYGIKTIYALSTLSGRRVPELVVYVEDDVASALYRNCVPSETRKRTRVEIIGGFTSVAYQLAAFRLDPGLGNVLAIVDGDVRQEYWASFLREFAKSLGRSLTEDDQNWIQEHVASLPGMQPEKYIWDSIQLVDVKHKMQEFGFEENDIEEFCALAPPSDWHDIPFLLCEKFALDREAVVDRIASCVVKCRNNDFLDINAMVSKRLSVS